MIVIRYEYSCPSVALLTSCPLATLRVTNLADVEAMRRWNLDVKCPFKEHGWSFSRFFYLLIKRLQRRLRERSSILLLLRVFLYVTGHANGLNKSLSMTVKVHDSASLSALLLHCCMKSLTNGAIIKRALPRASSFRWHTLFFSPWILRVLSPQCVFFNVKVFYAWLRRELARVISVTVMTSVKVHRVAQKKNGKKRWVTRPRNGTSDSTTQRHECIDVDVGPIGKLATVAVQNVKRSCPSSRDAFRCRVMSDSRMQWTKQKA